MRKGTIFLLILGAIFYVIILSYGIYRLYFTPIGVSEIKLAPHPEDRIAIAHKEIFGKLDRPQVIFNHDKHVEALMKAEGKKPWATCAECHGEVTKGKKHYFVFKFPKGLHSKDPKVVMKAYHDACIGCHKKFIKEGKHAGPITCAGCHVEKTADLKITYPAAEFDYKEHYEHIVALHKKTGKPEKETCAECHYTYDLKTHKLYYKKGAEESCYYCHKLDQKNVTPELAAILRITKSKDLDLKTISHMECISCHLKIRENWICNKKNLNTMECALLLKKSNKAYKHCKLPPVRCVKCHAIHRTLAELKKVPRPDRGQKDWYFLKVKNGRMKGVPFDHKLHEYVCKSCRDCHHQGLEACDKCHTLTGSPKGGYVTLAEAYHAVFAKQSCVGCHNRVVLTDKKCAGCHKFLPNMNVAAKAPSEQFCDKCHTGKKTIKLPKPFNTAVLDPKVVKSNIRIKVLEREFEPAKFPHRKIIDTLVKASNENKLARYFHGRLTVMCEGCHHHSKWDASAKRYTPPACKDCHPIEFDPAHPDKPRLLAAYHQQCIGCHKAMNLGKAIKKCSECHVPKKNAPSPKALLEIKKMQFGGEGGVAEEAKHEEHKD